MYIDNAVKSIGMILIHLNLRQMCFHDRSSFHFDAFVEKVNPGKEKKDIISIVAFQGLA
jgi:hypothetical protein